MAGESKRTEAMFWNVMAFIMVAILLVYVSDRVQMKNIIHGGAYGNSFAEDVVYKNRDGEHPKDEEYDHDAVVTSTPVATITGSSPPTRLPTLSPTTPLTTNLPTPSPSLPQTTSETLDRDEKLPNTASVGKNATLDGYKFPPTISVTSHGNVRYYTYNTRGRQYDDKSRQAMIDQWGSWSLNDDDTRPILTEDFYTNYPNRDVPSAEFPATAWQKNKTYLSKFLPEGISLVQRAQDAILAEYGQPTNGDWNERSKMFHITKHDEALDVKLTNRKGSNDPGDQGGWTTPESWDGLKRRMLHAIMTEDSFVFAMTGHSSSAGHGNHFQQSYTLQVQWIMEAVFARLGVRHQSRNFGNGGLGTAHNGIAAGSIFGPDVDVLMWDAGMTEGQDKRATDLTHRQALLSGTKVPFLFTHAAEVARFFHQKAGVHVGSPGTAKSGLIRGQNNLTKINTEVPWALRYMNCDNEISSVCKKYEYDGVCWIDRPDFTPTTTQSKYPGGRAGKRA
jgi:hypothetical protein